MDTSGITCTHDASIKTVFIDAPCLGLWDSLCSCYEIDDAITTAMVLTNRTSRQWNQPTTNPRFYHSDNHTTTIYETLTGSSVVSAVVVVVVVFLSIDNDDNWFVTPAVVVGGVAVLLTTGGNVLSLSWSPS